MRKSVWSLTVLTAFLLPMAGSTIWAQGSSAQSEKSVIIGCVQRAGARYALKDVRSGEVIGLDASRDLDMDFHVGHTVELVGAFSGGGRNATFKVDSVVYISQTCQ